MDMTSRIKQGVFHVREETEIKHPVLPIAKLKVPDARRVLPKGMPCLYITIRQGILHEKLFQHEGGNSNGIFCISNYGSDHGGDCNRRRRGGMGRDQSARGVRK